MFLKPSVKTIFIKLFLIISFLVCWFSISTSFEDLLIFHKGKDINLNNIINFCRHISIYFCFFLLILIFLIFNKKINFKKYKIFYLLIAYFAAQFIGLVYTGNTIENISFIFSSFTVILTIILIDNFFSYNEKKYFLLISFLILNVVFFLTFTPSLINYFNGGSIYGGFYSSDFFFEKDTPRSSGLARMALIIFIFIELFEIQYSKYLKNHSKKILLIKIIFLTFVTLFQSRTIIFITVIICFFIYLNRNKFEFNKVTKFISIYFFIPTFLFFSLSTFNSYQSTKLSFSEEDIKLLDHLKSDELRIFRGYQQGDISSGRFSDWKEILDNVSGKNIIYGYGAQGDRYLINQTASNGLIYTFVSSGLIGLIFFIIFNIAVCLKIIKIFFYYFKENSEDIIYCLILLSLSLRGILETSYAVFSIDLIIFILALSFIFDSNIRIKDIKIKYSK